MKILQIYLSNLQMFNKPFLDTVTHPMFRFGLKHNNYWMIRVDSMIDNLYHSYPQEVRNLAQLMSLTHQSGHDNIMIIDR